MDDPGGVVLVNAFEGPADGDDAFLAAIGRHQSPQAFQAAVGQPGFREATAAIQHRGHPSLYRVVRR
jgi:hypothetical protein